MTADHLTWTQLKTPLGPISVAWGGGKLQRILLNEGRPKSGTPDSKFSDFLGQLDDYLSGRKVKFRVPIDLSEHTPFRREVLLACSKIPHGQTRTYGDLAHEVGNPLAARAVGQAMAHNTLPLVVPCHRVLSSQGAGGFMGDFLGGLEWKRWLLQLEGVKL